MDHRQKLVFHAELAKNLDRHEDAIADIKDILDEELKLSIKEICILNSAYKEFINKSRYSRYILSKTEVEMRDSGKLQQVEGAVAYKEKINKEIRDTCNEFIKIINEKIIPSCQNEEIKMICNKLKGDYYHILADIEVGNLREKYLNETEMSYIFASLLAKDVVTVHEERFSLMLNYALFTYYELKDPQKAYIIADTGYHLANAALLRMEPASDPAISATANTLKEYLHIWKSCAEQLDHQLESID